MRGADIVMATLAAAGVRRVFSLSGNQIMPLYDAAIDQGIEIVHTRHEASAVFMADAYAQLTGGIGVALVTAAPGFANALGPLFSARQSESPVLLLSGDSPLAQDGRGAFQEMDQVAASAPLTKMSARPQSTECLGVDIANAISTSLSGRPGPVHLALAFDVLQRRIDGASIPDASSFQARTESVDDAVLNKVRQALAQAERPVLIAGSAFNPTRAPGLLDRLAAACNAPAVAMESPRGLNDPALGAFKTALAQADLVISFGKRIDFTVGFGAADKFGEACRFVVIDSDQAARDQAARNLGDRLTALLDAGPQAVAAALCAADPFPPTRDGWRATVSKLVQARDTSAASGVGKDAITPVNLCAAVQRAIDASGDGVLIADGGEFGQWAQACVSAPRRVINGPSGAIGGSLCFAVGAASARPQSTVFSLMGDGTVGFQFAEFETAARAGAAFVVVIGNDRSWNAEHQIQLRDYGAGRLIGCELSGARYDLAAAALGGHGEYVTDASQLDEALARAVASKLPACVNVEMTGFPAPAAPAH